MVMNYKCTGSRNVQSPKGSTALYNRLCVHNTRRERCLKYRNISGVFVFTSDLGLRVQDFDSSALATWT